MSPWWITGAFLVFFAIGGFLDASNGNWISAFFWLCFGILLTGLTATGKRRV